MDLNSRILSCLHRLGESKVKYQEGFVYMVRQGGSIPASFLLARKSNHEQETSCHWTISSRSEFHKNLSVKFNFMKS